MWTSGIVLCPHALVLVHVPILMHQRHAHACSRATCMCPWHTRMCTDMLHAHMATPCVTWCTMAGPAAPSDAIMPVLHGPYRQQPRGADSPPFPLPRTHLGPFLRRQRSDLQQLRKESRVGCCLIRSKCAGAMPMRPSASRRPPAAAAQGQPQLRPGWASVTRPEGPARPAQLREHCVRGAGARAAGPHNEVLAVAAAASMAWVAWPCGTPTSGRRTVVALLQQEGDYCSVRVLLDASSMVSAYRVPTAMLPLISQLWQLCK